MRAGLVVAALCAAGPALADCGADWAAIELPLQISGLTIAQKGNPDEAEGWCRIGALEIVTGGEYAPDYLIGSVEWRGEGIAGLIFGKSAPEAIDLRIRDFRFAVKTPDPVMTYLIRAQSAKAGIDGDLSVLWDKAAKTLTVSRADLDFPGENAIRLSASVSNVDLSDTGKMQMTATGFAVNRLRLEIQSNGLFESYFLMALGGQLLDGSEDPAAEVEALKTATAAAITELPEASFPAETKAALAAVVAEMPNPAGRLTVEMTSEAGIGPARVMTYALYGVPQSVGEMAHIFNGMNVTAVYEQTEAEE